ncbi:integrase-like protein [Rhodopseudomonas thermotolerans]|uniref:Integrase-like protein n=2 Tax=Rhodopseudomonas TaxID=1073 RepID=A0A336JMV2_9BRAD|nr:integrase-like protein [Rhodopseudomonas pentothenatexigens]REG07490.1 integrase-like protein [Rhodopseudomonas thermotolerans]SSW89389.1 integrase-like protein [Rhodopseudomonas pentothenatexigens]
MWQRHGLLTKHERLLRLEKTAAERTIELSEEQTRLLERFSPEFRERHIEAPHTGSLVAIDTSFVGSLKGVGKVYLQTAIDCHSRYAWARLYTSKLPVTAVHLMNHDALPTFEAHDARIETVLSDNGREFCGRPDQDPYELFLQLEDIDHRATRVKRPQSNGIVERLHRTLLDEHFRAEDRRTWFETVDEMQTVLDDYLVGYNQRRPHQGRGMNGRTPDTAFVEGLPASQQRKEGKKAEKQVAKVVPDAARSPRHCQPITLLCTPGSSPSAPHQYCEKSYHIRQWYYRLSFCWIGFRSCRAVAKYRPPKHSPNTSLLRILPQASHCSR